MPGYSYGISAKACHVGSKLVNIPGSTCHSCYALKGHYTGHSVTKAHAKRLAGLSHPAWVHAMVFMINFRKCDFFRWHDSGDLQSLNHLEKIADVAVLCPTVQFWMPTREKAIVHAFQRIHGPLPSNLVVRVSATMIDGPVPIGFANTSTVVTGQATCPAPQQKNNCGACRMCWTPSIPNVSYKVH